MAYNDAPFGFIPVRHRNGAPYTGAANPYWVDSGDGTALFLGDPVIIDGTSNTAEIRTIGGTFPPGTLPGVTRATAGSTNRVTGVVVGVAAVTRDSEVERTASTERVVFVADDPDLVFQVQGDGAIAAGSVGLNANIIFTHAGSASTGRSGAEINSATVAADATIQTQILRAVNDPQNEVNAAGNRFEVIWGLHTHIPAGGILGVA
jgi:hypothetical protein